MIKKTLLTLLILINNLYAINIFMYKDISEDDSFKSLLRVNKIKIEYIDNYKGVLPNTLSSGTLANNDLIEKHYCTSEQNLVNNGITIVNILRSTQGYLLFHVITDCSKYNEYNLKQEEEKKLHKPQPLKIIENTSIDRR